MKEIHSIYRIDCIRKSSECIKCKGDIFRLEVLNIVYTSFTSYYYYDMYLTFM